MIYLVNLISIIIVILFLLTATDKVLHWNTHINTVINYRILHNSLIKPITILMIIAEFYICVSLLFKGANYYNLFVFLSLLIVYTTAIVINLVRGNVNMSCGCGSVFESSNLNFGLVIRNSLLVLVYLFVFLNNEYTLSQLNFYDTSVLIGLSIWLVLIWAIVKEFLDGKKILEKVIKIFHLEVN